MSLWVEVQCYDLRTRVRETDDICCGKLVHQNVYEPNVMSAIHEITTSASRLVWLLKVYDHIKSILIDQDFILF